MDYLSMNRQAWDHRAAVHLESRFYDVPGFLVGKTSLQEIELAEMPDVQGKTLLHLQCHFGLDTLSWARKGARVTGVDFSPVAIAQAEEIAAQAGLKAQFICTDVYSFAEQRPTQYDMVFVSYGALCWLPDVTRWAKVVADSLKPGGVFYMVEFHPMLDLLDGYPYFPHQEADIEESGTYTENDDGSKHAMAEWSHPLSEVVNALIRAGIVIEHLNEFPFSPYNCFENLLEREPGRYYLSTTPHPAPLLYSITGRKAESP